MSKKKENTAILVGAAALIWWLWPSGNKSNPPGGGGGGNNPPNNNILPPGQNQNVYTADPGAVASFINQYNNAAQAESAAAPSPGISPIFILAQAGVESNWGTSNIFKNANNAFGIKADAGWKGQTYNGYRAYATVADSFADHLAYLLSNSNYKSLWDSGTNDPLTWATLIQSTGYSTDPNYGNKIISAISLINDAVSNATQGIGATKEAQEFISAKIEELIKEGYSPKRAEAAAYSEARKRRFKV